MWICPNLANTQSLTPFRWQDNEGMAERTVIVKDTTEPVLILNGIGSIAEINVSDKGFNYLDANVIIQGDGEGGAMLY